MSVELSAKGRGGASEIGRRGSSLREKEADLANGTVTGNHALHEKSAIAGRNATLSRSYLERLDAWCCHCATRELCDRAVCYGR